MFRLVIEKKNKKIDFSTPDIQGQAIRGHI